MSFVRARGVHCLMGTSLKRDARRFPFSLSAREAFPFPFVPGRLPFSLDPPLPQNSYPTLVGLIGM